MTLPGLIRPAGTMRNGNRAQTPDTQLTLACLEESAAQVRVKPERERT